METWAFTVRSMAGPIRRLEIEDPNERVILVLRAVGRLARQGLTQLFFESAEPTFDELEPEEFFRRFPEGTYEIDAVSLTGEEIEGHGGAQPRAGGPGGQHYD